MSAESDWTCFRHEHSAKTEPSWKSFVDIHIPIPAKPEAECGVVVPSMSLSGSTFITQSTVLTDQHRFEGRCDVLYWLTAEFKKQGAVTKSFCQCIDIERVSEALLLTALPLSSKQLECVAAPTSWSILRKIWSSERKPSKPTLQLSLPSDLGSVRDSQQTAGVKGQSVTIPITVSLRLPPQSAIVFLEDGVLHHGLSADVTAKWHTRKAFATAGLLQSSGNKPTPARISKNTIVVQQGNLLFPPLVCHRDQGHQSLENGAIARPIVYSTTDFFQLLLPETVTSPSVSTDLLRISYELELVVSFKASKPNIGDFGRCTARIKVPLLLRPA